MRPTPLLLRSRGFQDLRLLSADSEFAGVRLLKTTSGQHGSDRTYAVPAMAERSGEACGVVFRHPQEKTLWLMGIPSGVMTLQPTC